MVTSADRRRLPECYIGLVVHPDTYAFCPCPPGSFTTPSWGVGSPNARHQPVTHVLCVVVVSGQLLTKELLLVEDAHDQREGARDQDEQAPVRAQRERRADQHDEHAPIHRVPHPCVQPGGHHLLLRLDGDVRCGITVLDYDELRETQPDRYQRSTSRRDGR